MSYKRLVYLSWYSSLTKKEYQLDKILQTLTILKTNPVINFFFSHSCLIYKKQTKSSDKQPWHLGLGKENKYYLIFSLQCEGRQTMAVLWPQSCKAFSPCRHPCRILAGAHTVWWLFGGQWETSRQVSELCSSHHHHVLH